MMKRIFLFLILNSSIVLGELPWIIDSQQASIVKEQIELKQRVQLKEAKDGFQKIDTATFKDYYYCNLNFNSDSCPYCQNQDTGEVLEKYLSENGFYKVTLTSSPPGHCLGITYLFGQYILANPPTDKITCREIVEHLTKDPEFKKNAHQYSVNQIYYYSISNSPEGRVMFLPESAEKFLSLQFGHNPDHYFLIDSQLEEPILSIYLTLGKLQNRFILFGYNRGVVEKIDFF